MERSKRKNRPGHTEAVNNLCLLGCGGLIARRLVKRKARSRATLAKPC